MALLQLLTFGLGVVTGQTALGGLAETLAVQISMVLFAPVSLCGAAAFSLDILHGGAPKPRLMFTHVRDFRRTVKIWLATLAYYGPVLAFNVTTLMLMTIPSGASESNAAKVSIFLLLIALVLVLMVFGLWFSLRLGLFCYVVAKNPEAGAGEWLKASWRAMRRNCGRLFRLMFSVFWPSVTIGIIISLIAGRGTASGSAISLPTLSIMIFQCFYVGYPQLALAGFADDLLGENQSM